MSCRAIGRKSLEATNTRFILWARAAVTFLRWCALLAVFLWVVLVAVLCPGLWVVSCDDESLDCAAIRGQGTIRASNTTEKRIAELTLRSVARFTAGAHRAIHLPNRFLVIAGVKFAIP